MEIIPSLDIERGRSRLVFWPGAATGTGTPTDRPDRICRWFVGLGARVVHLVDLDGARQGAPANLGAIQDISRAVAVPLQVAGGVDGPEQIELVFAAGATRVVMPLWAVADDASRLRACLAIAGDWLAVGLDGRPEQLARFTWQRSAVPTLDELLAELADGGVRRFVVSHAGDDNDVARLCRRASSLDADLLVAGGVTDVGRLQRLRDAGVDGVILGEAILTGQIDYATARALAA